MYIRKVMQKNFKTGKQYCTYRLAETYRNAEGNVRQRVVLNLGSGFDVPKNQWKLLADRVEEIISGQRTLFILEETIESVAQSIASRTIKRLAQPSVQTNNAPDYQSVDLQSLNYQDVRQAGGEHVTLETAKKLELPELLASLNFNRKQINVALGAIIGRLIAPGSERSTHKYLQEQSALGDLLGLNFGQISLDSMYSIADMLEKHKATIEAKLFNREKDLFKFSEVITLYDLTNTYFEGDANGIEKAEFGRSKEKRSDCPIVTLGFVLDSSGFPKQSQIFAGNISEPKTLQEMIGTLKNSEKPPTIVMDAGIATEENIQWLKENDYKYIVVSRKKLDPMDFETGAVNIEHRKNYQITAKLIHNNQTEEQELYCYSAAKEQKEISMQTKATKRFEEEIKKLIAGLTKKGGVKKYNVILERVGKIKQRHRRISGLYNIEVTPDEKKLKAAKIEYQQTKKHKKSPGVYCLRSNHRDLKEQELWSIYTMLTDLESAFRTLKTELGLRPIYHQKTNRVDSHIFISIIAYHLLHTIRYQLKAENINESWQTIREELRSHCRITSTIKTKAGRTVHIRKSSQPTARQAKIYTTLKILKWAGKTEKTFI